VHESSRVSIDFSFLEYKRVLDLHKYIERERERGRGPSATAKELELAISGSLMEICSKAATSDAARSMLARRRRGRWQRRGTGLAAAMVELPAAPAPPSRSA